jgi:hypothetical protein
MSCKKCSDLCVRIPLHHPSDLRRAIQIANENVVDGTISDISDNSALGGPSFSQVFAGEPWDDIVGYRFKCTTCGELFSLHAETYHGHGGFWEPENRKSVREDL